MSHAVFQLDGITKTYPATGAEEAFVALSRVDLDIAKGEFLSIIGPSGCGKTTLLNLLAGFLKPSTGTVWRSGLANPAPGPDRTMMFQDYALYPWMTVAENVGFGLLAKSLPRRERDEIVRHFIRLVRLQGFEDKYPDQLSGGMRQRVSIARALAPDPAVVLMDEPFGALDSLTRDEMQEELLSIWAETGKTFVLVTHSIDEAVFLSDRVIAMSAKPGRIQTVLDIPLARPRRPDIRTRDADFLELKQTIFDLLHHGRGASHGPSAGGH
ncbi:ABC transporter ATP-binding protein [Methylopila musalis]|uniref:ABC transporter ATP-binding protein n=1 Tax=Methylopila musalis TaxID=1134781 RepID=A0ABW3Z489_9HYPH